MPFLRGLSRDFERELVGGTFAPLLTTCRRAGLDLRIRADYVDAYWWAGSLMNLSADGTFACHAKYVAGTPLEAELRKVRNEYRVGAVTTALVSAFDASVSRMRANVEKVHGTKSEGEVEHRLATHNGLGAQLQVIDRQVTGGGIDGRVDLVGITSEPTPRFVIVEVKRGLNNDLQEASKQVTDYVRAVTVDGGLRSEFVDAYRAVCRNLLALGIPVAPEESISLGMPVVALLALAEYKVESELLARARDLAEDLSLDGYFVLLQKGALTLPAPEKWRHLRRDE